MAIIRTDDWLGAGVAEGDWVVKETEAVAGGVSEEWLSATISAKRVCRPALTLVKV